MELSPGRQKLLFVAIVAVLAVFGYFLVVPALHSHDDGAAKAAASGSPSASAAAPSTAAPAATQVPAGTVDIYDWLPFTQQDLAEAAAVAVNFGVDYDSFAPGESATSYIAKMNGLITGQLAAFLQNAYSTQGVAGLRKGQDQTATASASIVSLRAFGSSSLTFIVNIAQRLVSSQKITNSSTPYAVTLTGSDGSWQVSDVELADEGNF